MRNTCVDILVMYLLSLASYNWPETPFHMTDIHIPRSDGIYRKTNNTCTRQNPFYLLDG